MDRRFDRHPGRILQSLPAQGQRPRGAGGECAAANSWRTRDLLGQPDGHSSRARATGIARRQFPNVRCTRHQQRRGGGRQRIRWCGSTGGRVASIGRRRVAHFAWEPAPTCLCHQRDWDNRGPCPRRLWHVPSDSLEAGERKWSCHHVSDQGAHYHRRGWLPTGPRRVRTGGRNP